MANLFLDKGTITYLTGQHTPKQSFEADPAKQITKLPVVTITNRGTSGAAEVAATALADNKRADSVGERTYGDAAMRKAVTLDDGSAVILAVAKYYSASSGKAIQDTGFTPANPVSDFDTLQADLDDDSDNATAAAAAAAATAKPVEDLPLKKAIERSNAQ